MATAKKRIAREYAEIQENPLEGIFIDSIEADIFKWHITLMGPKDSPYAGGCFKLLLVLPENYPFKPPTLSFKSKIYHPNITNDEKGSMCLGILRTEVWKPSCKIISILEMASGLLLQPNIDDAIENTIAEEYKNKRASFEKTAKDWTKLHALNLNRSK